jgi:hypothetical protein
LRPPLVYCAEMANQNFAKERQRLAELYAGMEDGELEKLASEAAALTDVAREALTPELSKGKLGVALSQAAPVKTEEEHPKLVILRKFLDAREARLAKGSLESAGIDCFLADGNTVGMDSWPSMIEGTKLWVREEDAAAADEILRDRHPGASS